MVTDLFPSGFIPPVNDQQTAIGGGNVLTTVEQFFLVDDGTIPSNAVISSVQIFCSQGSFTPGVIPAGIQPFYLYQFTQWSGPGNPVPPTVGQVFGNNEVEPTALTPVLLVNPITGIAWVRPDLFLTQWGWWVIWNNIASPIPQSVQLNSVTQYVVRVTYDIPVQPDPIVYGIELTTLTEIPETYTFLVRGANFQSGSSVIVTPPVGSFFLVSGADVLRVVPEELDFVVNAAQIGLAGDYTLQVLGPTGQMSNTLTFTMAGPGVIVIPSPGVMHVYGYAFLRPGLPNLTNEPLGLVPGATITVFESTTLNPVPLFSDPAGLVPLINPFVADTDAFWSCYLVPEAIDVQFSGEAIQVPYTIGDYLPLDPRIPPLEAAVTALSADIAAGINQINGVVNTFQQVPLAFPLGGSLTEKVKSAVLTDVLDAVTIILNSSLFVGYVVTVFVTLQTDDPGTSVQAILRNVDDNLTVGTSASTTSTTGVVLSFPATLTPGSKHYRLQLLPGNGNAFVSGNGYLQLATT